MTAGIATTPLASGWLNVLRGTSFTGYANIYVKLHIGDPGAAGANNAATGSTTRPLITWSAPSAGAMALSNSPSWTNGGATETLSFISFWDSPTAGNFIASAQLASSQPWASGNNFALTSQTWTLTPLAS